MLPRPLRAIAAAVALLGIPLGLAVALVAAAFGGSPVTVIAGLFCALGALPTAWALWKGSPLRPPLLAPGVVVFAAGLALAGGVAIVRAVEAWQGRRPFAEEASTATAWLAVAAGAALCVAVLAASVERRPAVLASLALSGVLLLLALGALAAPGGCETFRLDDARWRAALAATVRERRGERNDAELIAGAVARCGVLDRAGRATVRRRLGPPDSGRAGRTDRWFTGEVNDGIGPGDAGELSVVYDRGGRVRAVDPPGG